MTADRLTLLRERAVRGAFASALGTVRVGRVIEYHEVIATTMDRAEELARSGPRDGAVVVADHQTAGRGRRGRSWGYGGPGTQLLASWVLRSSEHDTLFVVLSAIALLRASRALGVERLSVKWPNDLLLSGRKVAGVLSTNVQDGRGERWLVLGTGLDVHTREYPEEAPGDVVTSFARSGHDLDRLALLAHLARELESLRDGGAAAVAAATAEWRASATLLGHRVRVQDGGRAFDAEALDLDADGALLVRRDEGEVERVVAGDVSLRPA